MMETHDRKLPSWIPWFALISLLIGAALRLIWLSDMEYKYDEQFMFSQSQNVGVTEPWPAVGMPSGVSLRNPGMSIWVFVVLARIFGISDPVSLTTVVAILSIAAIATVVAMTLLIVKKEEREAWFWGAALVAVNPIALSLHRKIWAQSILPIFCILFLLGWFRREKNWGAFVWGLIGACLGQIHMSGFFYAAALFLWTAFFKRERVKWFSWAAGSSIGALGLIPWVQYILANQQPSSAMRWIDILQFRFWRLWILEPLGFHVNYSLGSSYPDYLRYPLIGGMATYLVAIAHLATAAIGLYVLWISIAFMWKNRRQSWKNTLIGGESETAFLQQSAFLGFGGLLNLGRVYVHRHYLIITFPLQYVWLARQALGRLRPGRALLLILWCAQLLISATFLYYIHVNGGARGGDYGISYSRQAR